MGLDSTLESRPRHGEQLSVLATLKLHSVLFLVMVSRQKGENESKTESGAQAFFVMPSRHSY